MKTDDHMKVLKAADAIYKEASWRMWAATKFAPKPWEGQEEKTTAIILNQVDLGETIQLIESQYLVHLPFLIHVEAHKKTNRQLSQEAKKLLLQFTALVQRCRYAKQAYQIIQ